MMNPTVALLPITQTSLALVVAAALAMLLSGCADTNCIPSWHQKLPVAERFEPVLGGAAILDRETGLVWEKAPAEGYKEEWKIVVDACYNKVVGERTGWRVPARFEFLTLAEVTGTYRGLPAGHPFQLTGSAFWTATDHTGSLAWAFSSNSGNVFLAEEIEKLYLWCVRGGHVGYDVYGNDGPGP